MIIANNKTLDWLKLFPNGNIKSFAKNQEALKHLLVAFDSEYQQGIHCSTTNTILCYSYAVFNLNNGRYHKDIIKVNFKYQERLSLQDIIQIAANSIGIKGTSLNGYKIILVAHFFTAEFCSIKNKQRTKLLQNLNLVNNTLISNGYKSFQFYDKNRNKIKINIRFCDTMLLLPESHKSLQKASSLIDDSKIDLNNDEKSNMLSLMINNPKKFEEYAIRDSEVTLKLFIALIVYFNKLNNTKGMIFTTLSSASVKKYKKYIKDIFKKINLDINLIYPGRYNFSNDILEHNKSLAKRAYLGGLNNAYLIGEFTKGVFLDIDLSSCYPTAMSLLYMYDIKECTLDDVSNAVQNFNGTQLCIGCADVTFSFHDSCLYPCLSIRDDKYGLIQPLAGRTVATIPELHLALKLGADLEFHDGFVFNNMLVDGEPIALFQDYVKIHISARNEAKKEGNELLQQLLKTYNNSLYGKLGQGINDSKVYDIRNGYSKRLNPSSITNPYLAMMITGFIRAVLSSIIVAIDSLKKEGLNYELISATTDGVLYKSPFSSIDIAIDDQKIQEHYNGDLKTTFKNGSNNFIKSFNNVDKVLYEKLQDYESFRLYEKATNNLSVQRVLDV